jgi:hypothetical protein
LEEDQSRGPARVLEYAADDLANEEPVPNDAAKRRLPDG